MKKIFALSILVIFTLFFISCDDDSSDPAPTTGTIVVHATYSGAEPPSAKALPFTPGTKVIFVYVYSALTNSDDSRATNAGSDQTAIAVTVGTEYTLTIDNLTPGDYKVVAFYDYSAGGSNLDSKSDKFEIYNNAVDPDSATLVTVEAGSTDELTMVIDGTNALLNSSYFVAQPAL